MVSVQIQYSANLPDAWQKSSKSARSMGRRRDHPWVVGRKVFAIDIKVMHEPERLLGVSP